MRSVKQEKPAVVKLDYGGLLVGVTGFEPMASWSRTKRDTKLRHTPKRFKNYILLSRKLQELFSIKSPVVQNYSVRGAGEPNLSAPP